jgi:drug/metabolite transporter, DME family
LAAVPGRRFTSPRLHHSALTDCNPPAPRHHPKWFAGSSKLESTPLTYLAIGYVFLLVTASLWALITPASRFLLESGITASEIAFWRAAIAWMAFTAHMVLRGMLSGSSQSQVAGGWGMVRITPADAARIVAFGIFGIAGLYLSVPLAVAAGGAALASILLYTAPAWVAMMGVPLLGESMTKRKIAALGLTLAGVAAFGGGSGGPGLVSSTALAWGLVSGACYASLYLFGKIYFARYPPVVVFFWALPVACVVLLPLTEFTAKGPLQWAALLTVGLPSTYAAYITYAAGLARLEATRASIVATAEPVLAGLLAYSIWGERFSALGYLGGLLILIAVGLMSTGDAVAGRDAGRKA